MFFRKPSDHVPHVTIFHTILRSMLWILFIEIAMLVGILYLCPSCPMFGSDWILVRLMS